MYNNNNKLIICIYLGHTKYPKTYKTKYYNKKSC